MATATATARPSALHEKMSRGPSRAGTIIFILVLFGGLLFIGTSIARDMSDVILGSAWPYILLGGALLVALAFEFVNGFHDTANAVATVIYTHSLDPNIAVVWSGFWNFFGVVTSTGEWRSVSSRFCLLS
jgi:PiT family inorganic phosphate transporter